jgi:hypothetical protein
MRIAKSIADRSLQRALTIGGHLSGQQTFDGYRVSGEGSCQRFAAAFWFYGDDLRAGPIQDPARLRGRQAPPQKRRLPAPAAAPVAPEDPERRRDPSGLLPRRHP